MHTAIVVPAGASYNRRISVDPRYTNAYNFVHLNFEEEQGTVYLRRWSEVQDKWKDDDELWNEGRFSFSMPKNKEKLNPVTRDARQRLIRKFTPELRKRFCDELEVVVSQTLEVHGDISLVRSRLHYMITVAPGPEETFRIISSENRRVAKLIELGRVSTQPVELIHFKVDGQDTQFTATSEEDGRTSYEVDLGKDQVSIDFYFAERDMLDGIYTITVGRVTRYFKLTFVEDARLKYEYSPLGGFPDMKPAAPPILTSKVMEVSNLCFPHQGYMIEWHPPIT